MKRYERSELTLFKARVLEAKGDDQAAINWIVSEAENIVDNIIKNETLARLYSKVGDKDKTIDILDRLL